MDSFRQSDPDPPLTDNRFHPNPIPILKSQLSPSRSVHPQPDHIISMTDGHQIGLVRCHGMGMDGLLTMKQPKRMRISWIWRNKRFFPPGGGREIEFLE